jgi:sugar phosphate isomerase/epimerase
MKHSIGVSLSFERTDFGPVLFGGDLERGIRFVSKLGFPCIEISIRDPNEIDKERLLHLMSETGLSLSGIATGQAYYNDGLSLVDSDSRKRSKCLERLKAQIDLASTFGATVIIGGIRGVLSRDPSLSEKQKTIFYAYLEELADYASKVRANLAIEPINRYETNFINTVPEGLDIISRLGRDNVGLLVDTFHMNIEEPRFRNSILMAGKRIAYVHIADSNRLAPGYGHVDFLEVFDALHETGYDGPIVAEVLPRLTHEDTARDVMEFWKRCF